MNVGEVLGILGSQLVSRLPLLLVWGWGVFVAGDRYKTHRESSQLILGGIALCFVSLLISLASTVLITVARQDGRSIADIGMIMSVVGVVSSVISCGGWALVLGGAFKAQSAASRSAGA